MPTALRLGDVLKTNARMRALLDRGATVGVAADLPPDARTVLDAGWTVGPTGALLLSDRVGAKPRVVPASLLGGHEYEINDVYLRLDDLAGRSDRVVQSATRTLTFAVEMLKRAAGLPGAGTLQATVGVFDDESDEDFDLQGGRPRFFTRRGDFPDHFGDLEQYRHNAMALLDINTVTER